MAPHQSVVRPDGWPRGIVFDLDGTLVDSVPAITASMNVALRSMDRPLTNERTVARLLGIPLTGKFIELLADLTPNEAEQFADVYRDHYRETCASATAFLPG